MKLRTMVSIVLRSLGAMLKRDWSEVREQRSRFAFHLMEGDAFDEKRLHLGLKLLRGKVQTISFRSRDIEWNAPANCTAITPFLLSTGGFGQSNIDALAAWLADHGGDRTGARFVLDVGANIGTTSVPLAKTFGFNVIAIEPIPENLQLLERNVARNHLQAKIQTVNAAVSTRRESLSMVTDPSNCGGAEILVPGKERKFSGTSEKISQVEVKSMSLNEVAETFVGDFTKVAVVWSDTQGYETQVVASGDALWRAGVPLYVELWPSGLEVHGGIGEFISVVNQYFASFIAGEDLCALGNKARARPISELPGYLKELGDGNGSDGLFLPKEADSLARAR